jgi:glycerol-3-phosphate acyltransferase PlsX
MIATLLREEFKRNWLTKLAALLAYPVLQRFRERVDSRRYNGASLLGLRGIVVKSHGGADQLAFQYAIEQAVSEVKNRVLQRIEHGLSLRTPAAAGEES